MSNLQEAAKTLKSLDPKGAGLRCKESASPEDQAADLKLIRRAAGNLTASFIMEMKEYPRDNVIMDAVHAVRTTLFAADAESKFIRGKDKGGGGEGGVDNTMLNRRVIETAAGARATQGLL